MYTSKELDLLLEKAQNGNVESIKTCLDAHIPVYALPAMTACCDYGFNSPEIIDRIKFWEDCHIELLGRTMRQYSLAFQKVLVDNISEDIAFKMVENEY